MQNTTSLMATTHWKTLFSEVAHAKSATCDATVPHKPFLRNFPAEPANKT
jgi:hypothetical protein